MSINIKSCCFCEDLNNQNKKMGYTKDQFFNKICIETQNFASFPSLSPVGPGHCLIIPKYHITSMKQINIDHHDEYLSLLNNIQNILESTFGNIVIFEHGIGKCKEGGCGVTHAHTHLMHLTKEKENKIKNKISKDFPTIPNISLSKIFNKISINETYILFGSVKNDFVVSKDIYAPSQYLRKYISKELKRITWDWRDYYGWEEFSNTQRILSK